MFAAEIIGVLRTTTLISIIGVKYSMGKRKVFKKKQLRVINYLKSWKKQDTSWKFSKSLQNWVVKNSMERTSFSKSKFKTLALPYIESIKGQAKKTLILNAQKLITDGNVEKEISAIKQEIEQMKLVEDQLSKVYILEKRLRALRSKYKRAKRLMKIGESLGLI